MDDSEGELRTVRDRGQMGWYEDNAAVVNDWGGGTRAAAELVADKRVTKGNGSKSRTSQVQSRQVSEEGGERMDGWGGN